MIKLMLIAANIFLLVSCHKKAGPDNGSNGGGGATIPPLIRR